MAMPLYVIIVTSFKTIGEITLGRHLRAAACSGPSSPGGKAWNTLCTGLDCDGIKVGLLELDEDPVPEPRPRHRASRRSPATRWRCGTCSWAKAFLFVLFMCAFVPFQIIMIPLIVIVANIGFYGIYLGHSTGAHRAGHAAPHADLPQLLQGHPRELINAAIMDSGSFWRIFGEIILPMSGNIMVVVLIL